MLRQRARLNLHDPQKRYQTATQFAEDLERRRAGRRIKFHSDKDYSPVHVVQSTNRGDEDKVQRSMIDEEGQDKLLSRARFVSIGSVALLTA